MSCPDTRRSKPPVSVSHQLRMPEARCRRRDTGSGQTGLPGRGPGVCGMRLKMQVWEGNRCGGVVVVPPHAFSRPPIRAPFEVLLLIVTPRGRLHTRPRRVCRCFPSFVSASLSLFVSRLPVCHWQGAPSVSFCPASGSDDALGRPACAPGCRCKPRRTLAISTARLQTTAASAETLHAAPSLHCLRY
jgi:hypothetical protein